MTSTCNHRVCHPRMCVLCIPMLFIGTPVGDPLLALSSPNAPVGDLMPVLSSPSPRNVPERGSVGDLMPVLSSPNVFVGDLLL